MESLIANLTRLPLRMHLLWFVRLLAVILAPKTPVQSSSILDPFCGSGDFAKYRVIQVAVIAVMVLAALM